MSVEFVIHNFTKILISDFETMKQKVSCILISTYVVYCEFKDDHLIL